MPNLTARLGSMLHDCKVPRDGMRRYIYDIWQPLALLVVTVSFTAAFFTKYNPHASTKDEADLFFCNADGKLEKTDEGYKPFWDPQLYFVINIAFGAFNFTRVKVIDAAWDAVVGRGVQFVAALVAYQTLRRSITLTMETCTITIPAVATIYCRQIQLLSVGQLLHTMFWHWGSVHLMWRQPTHIGRIRLGTQLFVCIYVLLFATLVSIMTGYRAQLSAYFRYDGSPTGQYLPIDQLVQPRMVLLDGHRVGISETPLYAHDSIPYPDGVDGTDITVTFNTSDFIASFRDFPEPFGVLLDYHFTCILLQEVVQDEWDTESRTSAAHTFNCSIYDCSCSLPVLSISEFWTRSPYVDIVGNMTSTITISGESRRLLAPPLEIGLMSSSYMSTSLPNLETIQDGDARDRWSGFKTRLYLNYHMFLDHGDRGLFYTFNETALEEEALKRDGSCIAEDAYSWGFSSLLLLTFCCYTIAFALALILLQTDVYWNSRHDRNHQSHSIYTDVLYLAEELKKTFGQNIEDHMQSPKAFEKQVGKWKQGLRLGVLELPPSRWQERRLSLTTRRATRKARKESPRAVEPTIELQNMSSPSDGGSAVADTAYHGLIGGEGTESGFDAVSRSDRRSTSGELAPSFASIQRSMEGSGHGEMVLEDPVAESSLLGGDISGGAVHEGRGSSDQFSRRG